MQRTEPRVTVVIPFFNAELYLAETIDGVLAQTMTDWETILVDDGSTDESRTIANAYAEKHPGQIRVLEHEGHVNRGVCASRNLAIRMARGEFIATLDADDVWLPGKLEEQVAILDANPEAGMVYGHSRYWRSWNPSADPAKGDHTPTLGVETDRLYPPKALNLLLYPLAKKAAPCPSDLLLRTELVVRIGGFEEEFHHELQLYEDQAFLSKVYLHASVFVSGKTWDLYRLHPASCDSRVIESGRYDKVRRYFLEWLGKYLRRIDEQDPAIRKALREALFPHRHPWLHRLMSLRNVRAVDVGQRVGSVLDRFRTPPVGRVRMGSLRRLTPISRRFGYDRGLPIDRHYIESFLDRHRLAIHGRVLEIGDDGYTRKFGDRRVTQRDVLNVEAGRAVTTIVADLADAPQIPADSFDCIILTQTLQYVFDLESAVATLFRILRPGGILLVTVPGLSPISGGKITEVWYWGFSVPSLKKLIGAHFTAERVEVRSYGNVLSTTAFLHGLATEELKPSELEAMDPAYPIIVTAVARKAGSTAALSGPAPLVTVVIPCFNQAEYLGMAIESVLGQTWARCEIVVIDDGSTDNTSEVASKYGVKVVRQVNQGLAAARNTGLRESSGEFLVFLDSDDRLKPNAVEDGMRAFESRPDCGMVFGRYDVISESGAHVSSSRELPNEDDPYAKLLGWNYITMHGAAMFRRSTFDRVGMYDASLRASEDYDLYLRVAHQLPIFRHSAVVSEVRKHTSNMTGNPARMLSFTLKALRRQWPLVKNDPRLSEAYRKGVEFWRDLYGTRLVNQMRIAMVDRQWGVAQRAARTLVRYHPAGLKSALKKTRRSNTIDFVATTGPVPELVTLPPSGGTALVLRRLGDQGAAPGQLFNVQPGNVSGLWLECENATKETVIVFGGIPLATTFESPTLLTAPLAPELYAAEGRHPVFLLN